MNTNRKNFKKPSNRLYNPQNPKYLKPLRNDCAGVHPQTKIPANGLIAPHKIFSFQSFITGVKTVGGQLHGKETGTI
jgi:hypothetical protein